MAVNCRTPFIPRLEIVKVPPYTILPVEYQTSHNKVYQVFFRHQFSFQSFVPKHFHVKADLFQSLCISIHHHWCDKSLLCVNCYTNIDLVMSKGYSMVVKSS